MFCFPEMATWYEANRDNPALFENDRDVAAFLIEPSSRDGAAFVKRCIRPGRRLRFLQEDDVTWPHGVYVLSVHPTSLFFIYPKYNSSRDRDTGAAKQILVAQHFRFIYQPSLGLTDVHKVEYFSMDSDYTLGGTGRFCHTQLCDGAPVSPETFRPFGFQKTRVHAIATAHLHSPPSAVTADIDTATKPEPVSASLQAALQSCNVREVAVFCIRDSACGRDHWAITMCLSYTSDVLNRIGFYMEAEHLHWNAIEAQLIRSLDEYRVDILTVYESDEPDE